MGALADLLRAVRGEGVFSLFFELTGKLTGNFLFFDIRAHIHRGLLGIGSPVEKQMS